MPQLKLALKATVQSRSEASAYLKQPGDAVLVQRQEPRWLVLACPCGCGAEIPINLDRRSGPAWRLYRNVRGVSLYPSVWRDTDCESHFIILRNTIFLFGSRHDDPWIDDGAEDDRRLEQEILSRLSTSYEQGCEEIAEKIPGSVPWDILRICRKLCRNHLAIEGKGTMSGRFKALSTRHSRTSL